MLPGVPRHPFGNGTNAMLPMISMLPMILLCHRPTPEGDMAVGDTKCRYRTMDWNYLSYPPLTLFSRVLARTFHVFFKSFTVCLKLLWPELSILPVDHACHVCSGYCWSRWWLCRTAASEQQRSWSCRPCEESDGDCKRVNIPPQLQVRRPQKLLCRSWWLCALRRWLPGHLSPLWKLCQHLHPHVLVLLLRLHALSARSAVSATSVMTSIALVAYTALALGVHRNEAVALLWGRQLRGESTEFDTWTWTRWRDRGAKPPRLGRTVLRRVPAFWTKSIFLRVMPTMTVRWGLLKLEDFRLSVGNLLQKTDWPRQATFPRKQQLREFQRLMKRIQRQIHRRFLMCQTSGGRWSSEIFRICCQKYIVDFLLNLQSNYYYFPKDTCKYPKWFVCIPICKCFCVFFGMHTVYFPKESPEV